MHSDKNFSTDVFNDKTQAYKTGFNYLGSLKTLSDAELRQKLLVISQTPTHNIKIDDSTVSIQ